MNPGIRLPHHVIVPIRRDDASGDTFVFTQYLTFSTPSWENDVGYGTSPNWPGMSGRLKAVGNAGILTAVQQHPYSVSYLGVSYHAGVAKAGIGTAMLKSYSGQFLLPTPQTIAAGAASLGPRTPADERLTLVNAPGANAYPLINYEYAVVSIKQASPATADAIKRFLLWAIAPDETNAKRLEDQHFIALPAHIWVLSHDQIEKIG
jgi:phosphate transport system substrate-binding protein